MKTHDLLKDGLFEDLTVPAPESLDTTEDYAKLTQHLVSEFRTTLNNYYRVHGYEARLQLLTMLVLYVSELLPNSYPDCVKNYPRSLNDIYALTGNLLIMNSDRMAG